MHLKSVYHYDNECEKLLSYFPRTASQTRLINNGFIITTGTLLVFVIRYNGTLYEKKKKNMATLYALHPDWKWMVDICHVFAHQLLFIQCTHKPITSFNNSCHIIRRCCCKFYVLLLLFPCNTQYVYVIYVYHISCVW